MFRGYIVIALRRLLREKRYVSISILSLALGIASFLVLALYVRSELTYDKHHVNHDRIYRITSHFQSAGGTPNDLAQSQVGIGPLLTQEYPQLGKYVRFQNAAIQRDVPVMLKHDNVQRVWDSVFYADSTVFEVFTHRVIFGDAAAAFNSPYSIAISERVAKFFFGNANPIGKSILVGGSDFAVTLVFANLPENVHLKYDALLPFSVLEALNPGLATNYESSLWGFGVYTYLMVHPGFNRTDFKNIERGFFERHMAERAKQRNMTYSSELQPLVDIHFGEELVLDRPKGSIFYVYGITAVALFILAIACINYMNLATARATKRAKEVGMRKVLGASQSQLITQFLGESFTFTTIALLVGVILTEIALAFTPIGSLMGKEHLQGALAEPSVVFTVVILSAGVALVSGIYPAFYLSTISPLAALTQVRQSWRTGFSIRQILVTIQLALSIGVIAFTLLMIDQIRYIHNKPLGFDKENRLILTLRGYDIVKNTGTIKNELSNLKNVVNVTTINVVPGTGSFTNRFPTETNDGAMVNTEMDRILVGLKFVEGFNVKVLNGRGFSEEITTDAREAVIVNKSFVDKMGWQQPLGKRLQVGGASVRVIGVVQDFHYASLHSAIGPLLIQPLIEQYVKIPDTMKPSLTTSIIVSMSGQQLRETIGDIRTVMEKFDPNFNFEPVMMEDKLNELYKSETNIMKLTGISAAICIFVSLMGIFGLAAFMLEQRTKEIGIRQVLGASDSQICIMLTGYLWPLVAVASVPAVIAAYYVMGLWLQRFAYHVDISWLTFIVSIALVVLVAVATVVLQSLKAIRSNLLDAVRYE